jgi:hypothetical protein
MVKAAVLMTILKINCQTAFLTFIEPWCRFSGQAGFLKPTKLDSRPASFCFRNSASLQITVGLNVRLIVKCRLR